MEMAPARDIVAGSVPRPWTALGPPDAPVVVFLHGTRLTRAQWYPQLRRLAGRYRCIAIDLPGHGLRAGEAFTMDGAAAAVAEAIETEAPGRQAVVVGLSLGGYVAIEAAEARPDLVAGLVLAGCSAEPVGPRSWPFRAYALGLERLPEAVVSGASAWYFRMRYPASVAAPIVEAGFFGLGGARALQACMGRRYLERLGRLWIPVLIVNGALDPVFGPEGGYWAASCRAGREAVIPRAMHLVNLDRPRAFSRLVADFTERVLRPS